jgi:O-antigen/teichoic acid export membrane protein
MPAILKRTGQLRSTILGTISATAGIVWTGAALSIAVATVLARSLGPTGYGAYAYALTWVNTLRFFGQLGFERVLVRDLAAYEATDRLAELRGLQLSASLLVLVAACVLAALGELAGVLILSGPNRAAVLMAMPILPVVCLLGTQRGILQGLRHVPLGEIGERIVRPVSLIGVVVVLTAALGLNLGPSGAVAAALAASVMGLAFAIIAIRWVAPAKIRQQQPIFHLREWGPAALKFLTIGAIFAVNGSMPTLMLGSIGTPADVGRFSVALRLGQALILVQLAVNASLAPRIARTFATADIRSLQKLVSAGAAIACGWSVFLGVPMLLFSSPLLSIFGSGFQSAKAALAFVVLGQVVSNGVGPVLILLMMTRHVGTATWGVGVGAMINAGLCVALIPGLGATGAAVASTSSLIFWNLLLAIMVRRRLHVRPSVLSLIPSLRMFRSSTSD